MFVKTVDGKNYDNVYVIGDLHGEITQLNEALAETGFNKDKDLLLSVGDLIDRGENSIACLELINEPWFECVMGNHEKMGIDAVSSKSKELLEHWVLNGGGWFFESDKAYAETLLNKAAELPLIIEFNCDGHKIVICHADYPLDNYSHDNFKDSEMHLLWSRERIQAAKDGTVREIKGADLFIFGHTVVREPTHISNQLYIDTGACYNKELSIVKIK